MQIITSKNASDALPLYRHSTAHLLAAAVTNMFPGVQCGIGPPTDEGFFYDFVVPRPFVPEDLEAIEKKMRELADQDLVFERQMWPRDEAKRFFASRGEPLKVQLIEEKTEGQSDGLLLHDQGQGDVRRLLCRPARAVDRKAEGVQAAQHVERVLEGRRAQSADAARVRHGVPVGEGAQGSPHADRRSQEARPPEDRSRPEALHVPPVGTGRDVLAGERARSCTTCSPTTCATCSSLPATPR